MCTFHTIRYSVFPTIQVFQTPIDVKHATENLTDSRKTAMILIVNRRS